MSSEDSDSGSDDVQVVLPNSSEHSDDAKNGADHESAEDKDDSSEQSRYS